MIDHLRRDVNIQEYYLEFHLIAMEYNWEPDTIRNLRRSERKRWADIIETHLEKMYGEGD